MSIHDAVSAYLLCGVAWAFVRLQVALRHMQGKVETTHRRKEELLANSQELKDLLADFDAIGVPRSVPGALFAVAAFCALILNTVLWPVAVYRYMRNYVSPKDPQE